MIVKPPVAQVRACSTEELKLQAHLLGRSNRVHPYLRLIASQKAPLCRINPCSLRGKTVKPVWCSFLTCKLGGWLQSCRKVSFQKCCSNSLFFFLSDWIDNFIDCWSSTASPRSCSCCIIRSVMGEVSRLDWSKSSEGTALYQDHQDVQEGITVVFPIH